MLSGEQPAVLEGWVEYQQELSLLVARSVSGEVTTCGPIANDHANHILDLSYYPAPKLAAVADAAVAIAKTVAEQLELVGIVCVEMFLDQCREAIGERDRPSPTQFGASDDRGVRDFPIRAAGAGRLWLAVGVDASTRGAAMANLLGDLWSEEVPNWHSVLAAPRGPLASLWQIRGKTGAENGAFDGAGRYGPSGNEKRLSACAEAFTGYQSASFRHG